MGQSKTVKLAFWRGVMLGPLAVFPATVLATLVNVAFQLDSLSLTEALQASVTISMWGICIAYLGVATFGTAVWYGLWLVQRLSLTPLLLCATVPAFVTAALTRDLVVSAMVGYYSLAVCFTSWFAGLRNVSKL